MNDLADLIDHLDDASLPGLLVAALRERVAFDCSLVLGFRRDAAPELLFDDTEYAWRANTIAEYLRAAYLLDPFYVAVCDGVDHGVHRLATLAPDGFRDSEYYRVYYARSHVEDELCYIARGDDETTLVVSLERRVGSGAFADADVARCEQLEPVVRALLSTHWRVGRRALNGSSVVSASIQRAFGSFGSSVLTARECEVTRLLLGGHSTRSVAQRLHIAAGTVKIHRERIYAKLGISQQSELFRLFIDSACAVGDLGSGDPLAQFVRPARDEALQTGQ